MTRAGSHVRRTLADIRRGGGIRAALETSQPYDAADVMTSEVAAWSPGRDHPDRELGWARDTVTARARDLARNNGFAAGAVQREVDSVVGARFRPTSRPDWRALGIDRETAQAVGAQMDAAWRTWADDPLMRCDASRALDWGGLVALGYRTYFLEGDALAVLHWDEGATGFRTRLRVVDPDLLDNPQGMTDRIDMRRGVEIDEHGAALAYHFRRDHPSAMWGGQSWAFDRIERETEWGRPQIVHFFDKHRDGQSRGVSRLAPVSDALKMEDKYGRVELQAAVLSAILGVYVRSQLAPDEVSDLLSDGKFLALNDARRELIGANGLTFGGVRMPVLPPGDSIDTVKAERPGGSFEAFEAAVLRRIAAGLGTSYEQLAVDWSKTNYSSARAALVEIWRGWTARRVSFAQRWCAPIRLAVMEDAIDQGLVELPAGAPAFWEAPGAWLRAKWIGPGRGFVDPTKEAQAAAMRVSLGLSTMEDEAAELTGADYEDNLAQLSREIAEMPEGVLHPAQERFAELIGGEHASDRDAGPASTA
ncbi:phage portal protein, lambda family [Albimonas donghaensis]|uniref:Phage portal protein, lambda family n=1 Tax=Albimonas donghaensis TaxID=356660 RepID=A0A1H3FGK9_9RHOB|nr:phage portal protein [Albimonas donghaensis]SDX90172.1 phage portal protein, lambda family [Albimonas donghaensis]